MGGELRGFGLHVYNRGYIFEPTIPMLSGVRLETKNIGCSRDVRESLAQQFGTAQLKTSPVGVVSREWRPGLNDIEFSQNPDGWLGKPQHIIVVFVDPTNAVLITQ